MFLAQYIHQRLVFTIRAEHWVLYQEIWKLKCFSSCFLQVLLKDFRHLLVASMIIPSLSYTSPWNWCLSESQAPVHGWYDLLKMGFKKMCTRRATSTYKWWCTNQTRAVHIILSWNSKNSIDASSVKPLSLPRPTARTWTLDTRWTSSARNGFWQTSRPKRFVLDFPSCYKPWSPPEKAPSTPTQLPTLRNPVRFAFRLSVIDLRTKQEKVRHP